MSLEKKGRHGAANAVRVAGLQRAATIPGGSGVFNVRRSHQEHSFLHATVLRYDSSPQRNKETTSWLEGIEAFLLGTQQESVQTHACGTPRSQTDSQNKPLTDTNPESLKKPRRGSMVTMPETSHQSEFANQIRCDPPLALPDVAQGT